MVASCRVSCLPVARLTWIAVWLTLLLMLSGGVVAAEPPAKLRVLVFSGLNNHDWRSTTPVVQRALQACERFGTVDVTDDPAGLTAAKLAEYDVIVSNWTPYPDTQRIWPAATEAAFLDFVRGGGGFVVIHAAACTFQVWPEFQQLIALTWKADFTAHGAYHTFRVSVADSRHPIARGLSDFYTTDELYHNMVSLTDHPRHVVFQAFSAKEQAGTGRDEPVLVCTELGRGRGVNLVLGHDAAAMQAGFRTLLLRGTEWAATGNVTIPPPAIWPASPTAMAAAEVDPDATFAAVAGYTFGQDRQPLSALQQLVVYAQSLGATDASGFRSRLADRLAALLASADATPAAKAFVCNQIADLATPQHAPTLAALLDQPELADPALRALAQIPGAAVDRLLRDRLGRATGTLQIGLVNALGERRDCEAVEALSKRLSSGDEALVEAAARALGKLGGEAAAAALTKSLDTAQGRLRAAIAEACLTCAAQLLADEKNAAALEIYQRLSAPGEADAVRMAAWRGLVRSQPDQAVAAVCAGLTSGDPLRESMAVSLLPDFPGAAATAEFAACVGKVSPPVQVLLLGALANRRDAAARGAAEAAAAGADPAVRVAALKALGDLGDESTVTLLVERMAAGLAAPEQDAARSSLLRLRASGVDAALAARLTEAAVDAKVELIRILAARQARSATGALAKIAVDPDDQVRREAWKALGDLAGAADVPALLALVVNAADSDREAAEQAVAAALKRSPSPDAAPVAQCLANQPAPAAQASLLRILSTVGDDRSLPALRSALQSGDAGVRDAAVRGLAAWPTPAPFEDLVRLARDAPETVHRVLGLRGAIRLSSQVAGRTPEQMTALVGELLQLAREPAERKAVLAELGRCPTREALQLARQSLSQPEFATEAGVAITQIATALRDTHRDEAVAALRELLTPDQDRAVAGRAFKALKDILQPVNLALGATATSPDTVDPDGASAGDQAAIDGNPGTYWDEVDNVDEYRLCVTFPEPRDIASLNLLWHPYEQHQAKNFDVLCDGKLVAQVRQAACVEHEMFVPLPATRCTAVELVIPGKNGLVSPAIHELQIFGESGR